jgi:hypothetical protein
MDAVAPASSSPACDSTICTARRPAKTLVPLGSHARLRDHVVAGESRYWNSFDPSIAHHARQALWLAETLAGGSFACLGVVATEPRPSVEGDFPTLKFGLARRQTPSAVLVEPCRCSSLGVLLVHGFAVVVEF